MTALPATTAMSRDEAREVTEQIKRLADRLWTQLLEAYEGRAHEALGYGSWREYAQAEFDMSQSRAYQLLDAGRVVRELEEATVSTKVEISERDARDIKPHLSAVKDEIRERIDQGEDGHQVVREVINRTRDEEREHQDMVRRYRKQIEQWAVSWHYARGALVHEHREDIFAALPETTRQTLAQFERDYTRTTT